MAVRLKDIKYRKFDLPIVSHFHAYKKKQGYEERV